MGNNPHNVIMSITYDLAILQVDYTAAFVHADIDKPPKWDTTRELEKEIGGAYIEMPRGFGEEGKFLKLKKSLYELKQSRRNFFLHLNGKLEKLDLLRVKITLVCLYQTIHCSIFPRKATF
jgi:hypothetical protein